MKKVHSYVAPSDTAQLVDCAACHGKKTADTMVRVVSTDGVEENVLLDCATCAGSGKLWQDTQTTTELMELQDWQIMMAIIGTVVLIMPFLFFSFIGSAIGFGVWIPIAIILLIIMCVLGQRQARTSEKLCIQKQATRSI